MALSSMMRGSNSDLPLPAAAAAAAVERAATSTSLVVEIGSFDVGEAEELSEVSSSSAIRSAVLNRGGAVFFLNEDWGVMEVGASVLERDQFINIDISLDVLLFSPF